jgi:hypothetical protein
MSDSRQLERTARSGDEGSAANDAERTRMQIVADEWIARFCSRMRELGVALTSEELKDFATDLWPLAGHLSAEAVADAEHEAGGFDP